MKSPNRIPVAINPRLRLLGIVGVIGALFFLAAFLLMHLLRPDISFTANYVSGFANGPFGNVFRVAAIVHGFGNLAVAIGLREVFAESRHGRWGAVLFGVAALGIILGGFFSSDPPAAAHTIVGAIHNAVAAPSFPIEAGALFLLARAFKKAPHWSSLVRITKILGFAGTLGIVWLFIAIILRASPGLPERSVMMLFLLWEIIIAAHLVRRGFSGVSRRDF